MKNEDQSIWDQKLKEVVTLKVKLYLFLTFMTVQRTCVNIFYSNSNCLFQTYNVCNYIIM